MKNIRQIIASILFLTALSLSAQSSLLEYWTFSNATDGSGLQDVNNDGSIGSGWNFNTKTAGDEVNSGRLGFTGDEGYTRKATASNSIGLSTLGTAFRFEVNLAGWDLTNVAEGGKISFKLNEGTGDSSLTFAQVILEKDTATTARIRFSTRLEDDNQFFRNYAVNLTNTTAQNFAIEWLLGGKVNYLVDGQVVETSTENFGGITEYMETLVVKDFSGESGVVLELDSFGFKAIPEPATHALILGSLALALVAFRLRRV